MSLTLLALLILPLAFKMVLDPKGMRRVLKEWGDSDGLQFFSAITILILAMIMLISSTMSFKLEWKNLMTWLAVLTALKGVGTLVPGFNKWKVKLLTEDRMPIAGFASMLFALALVYIDTQVL